MMFAAHPTAISSAEARTEAGCSAENWTKRLQQSSNDKDGHAKARLYNAAARDGSPALNSNLMYSFHSSLSFRGSEPHISTARSKTLAATQRAVRVGQSCTGK